jgi:AraC family transcriptional regulator
MVLFQDGTMNYVDQINKAIDFIEGNLKNRFSPSDAAREACLSYYHFHRVFRALTGMTLGEYTKKRRLAEAAKNIIDGMDIAEATYEFQFNNQQEFTRSFKKQFGIPPGQYRTHGKKCGIMERCLFSDDLIKCFNTLCNQIPEIRYIEPSTYVGLIRRGENCHEENLKLNYRLVDRINEVPFRLENECTIFCKNALESNKNVFTYITGFRVSRIGPLPEGMISFVFGGSHYAIFRYRGTVKGLLGHIFSYIYDIWQHTVNYEIPPEAFNSTRFHNNICVPENEEMEIVIPVKEKQAPQDRYKCGMQ